jgi:serine/threonine protein kinase/WD40 repeat protein
MNQEQVRAIFAQAATKPTPTERQKYLTEACGTDGELRSHLDSLLQALGEAGGFLEKTVTVAYQEVDQSGSMVGRYKLLEKIGEGGFGVVYMAEQTEPVHRKVALKVIKAGMDTHSVVARFEAERQALAMMDHPNISRVLDAGTTDAGRPFFVMELVRGVPITEFCNQKGLPTKDRLQLFIKVCHAIQHAHQKGVVHRDIKPGNVLVTLQDGDAVPKVIDFGVAKALGQKLAEKTFFTGFLQLIGTPAYMSPEQAELSGMDIDTRADIYSLGVLLYELLTGVTPFDEETLRHAALDEFRRMIREVDPPKPSTRLQTLGEKLLAVARERGAEPATLSRLIRGDLDWIVMKCLEKNRERRYQTANGLALDVTRHLEDETVTARPPSYFYYFQKIVRRHKLVFAASTAVIATLVGGIILSSWQANRAKKAETAEKTARQLAELTSTHEAQQRIRAEESEHKAVDSELSANRLLYAADMRLANQAWDEGNLSRMVGLLAAHEPKPGQPDLRGFEFFCLQNLAKGEQERILYRHTNAAIAVAISPNGLWLASRALNEVQLWNLKTSQRAASLSFGQMEVSEPSVNALAGYCLSFSYDSQYLAIGTDRGLYLYQISTGKIRTNSTSVVVMPLFSPVTNRIAYERDWGGPIYIWDYEANQEVTATNAYGSPLCWSTDGGSLVAGRGSDTVRLWTVTNTAAIESPDLGAFVFSAAFSTNHLAAIADWQGTVHLLETPTMRVVGTLASGDIRASAIAFSPDGKWLATGGPNDAIQIWDVAERRLARLLRGHRGRITGLAFAPDGHSLASTAMDGGVHLWSLAAEAGPTQAANGLLWIGFPAPQFSPDGSLLSVEKDGGTRCVILDPSNLQEKFSFPGRSPSNRRYGQQLAGFSPDAKQFAVLSHYDTGSELQIWRVGAPTNRAIILLGTNFLFFPQLSADGKILAVVGTGQSRSNAMVQLFKAGNGELILTAPGGGSIGERCCLTADGRKFFSSKGSEIYVWDVASAKAIRTLQCNNRVWALRASPDSQTLAAGLDDNSILLWDVHAGTRIGTLTGHEAPVIALAFSPDGRTLASGCEDGALKLWSLPAQREVASFGQESGVYYLAFSPDGQTLISGGTALYKAWWAPRDAVAKISAPAPNSMADLPSDSIWRVPDGARVLTTNILASYREAALKGGATVRYHLGKIYEQGDGVPKDLKEALNWYTMAMESNDSAPALNDLAWQLVSPQHAEFPDVTNAIHLAKRAVAMDSRFSYYWYTIGLAYCRLGDFQSAITAVEQPLKRGGGRGVEDSVEDYLMAMAYAGLGKTNIARSFYHRGTRISWQGNNSEAVSNLRTEAGACVGAAPEEVAPANRAAEIIVPPSDQTVLDGAAVTLAVFADGSEPLSYQWFHDGQPMPGQKNALLMFEDISAGQGRHYSVSVSNAYGNAPGTSATLTVLPVRETTVAEADFKDHSQSWWGAFGYSESPAEIKTNAAIVPGVGLDGRPALMACADYSNVAKQAWAGFCGWLSAPIIDRSLLNTTDLSSYKLYAHVKTSGLAGKTARGEIQCGFSIADRDVFVVKHEATLTTNYQLLSFILSQSTIEPYHHCSIDDFFVNLPQIVSVRCTAIARNWPEDYRADQTNSLYIGDFKLVRLDPVGSASRIKAQDATNNISPP